MPGANLYSIILPYHLTWWRLKSCSTGDKNATPSPASTIEPIGYSIGGLWTVADKGRRKGMFLTKIIVEFWNRPSPRGQRGRKSLPQTYIHSAISYSSDICFKFSDCIGVIKLASDSVFKIKTFSRLISNARLNYQFNLCQWLGYMNSFMQDSRDSIKLKL